MFRLYSRNISTFFSHSFDFILKILRLQSRNLRYFYFFYVALKRRPTLQIHIIYKYNKPCFIRESFESVRDRESFESVRIQSDSDCNSINSVSEAPPTTRSTSTKLRPQQTHHQRSSAHSNSPIYAECSHQLQVQRESKHQEEE